ncbi:thiolase C-terminal domain-containing protein [Pseudomonas sp. BF-R-19]|uniref:thiolase C-terminal domain-containing protein n=1 Tax=Pseudomonas sp. BF-R-19 TaxID=2832397 RepID=UPI00398A00A7
MAWENAWAEAGVSLEDLDFVETHDCFTIAEMIEYVYLGRLQHLTARNRRENSDARVD